MKYSSERIPVHLKLRGIFEILLRGAVKAACVFSCIGINRR